MKKIITATVVLLSSVWNVTWAQYAGGTGVAESPYQIGTAEQLFHLAETSADYDKHFVLTANIDLTGTNLTAALISPNPYDPEFGPFTGVFDGLGYAISNLSITEEMGFGLALFGQVGEGGVIRNLGVVDAIIQGNYGVAILSSENYGSISNCWVNGSVSGFNICGGICGVNEGLVENCYSEGSVGLGRNRGGFCGINRGVLRNAHSVAAVNQEGEPDLRESTSSALTLNSVIIITPSYYIGGFCGQNSGLVTNCFWDKDRSGLQWSDGGVGISSVGMQRVSTFAEWDFDEIWDMATYPVLRIFPDPKRYELNVVGGQTEDLNGVSTHSYAPGTYISITYTNYSLPGQVVTAWEVDPVEYADRLERNTLKMPATSVTLTPQFEIYFDGGIGTVDYPFEIASTEQFLLLSDTPLLWNQHFKLTASLDLQDHLFSHAPIAFPESVNVFAHWAFSGSFDGDGFVISNLTITADSGGYIALFGETTSTAIISNFGLVDCSVSDLTRHNSVAAMVAYNDGVIANCFSTGTIVGAGGSVGGLCGRNYGSISDCYSTCTTSGEVGVGGVCGNNLSGSIERSYSTGTVQGGRSFGGFCGINNAMVSSCFWDIETSGMTESDGGAGKSTAEMQTLSTFTGWDFEAAWIMQGYPLLQGPAVLPDFGMWADGIVNHELRGPADTPMDDGIPNLLKYVCGLNANIEYSPTDLFTGAIEISEGQSEFILYFYKSPDVVGATVFPVVAAHLTGGGEDWSSDGIQIYRTWETDPDGRERWKAVFPCDARVGYLRLEARID